MKTAVTILVVLATGHVFGQSLSKFVFSECLTECIGDSSKIESIQRKGRLTIIELKTYAPCNGNLAAGIEVSDNNLNLKFWTKPTIIVDKFGKRHEIVEVADCDCMFKFTYHIKDLPTVDRNRIVVNSRNLKEIVGLGEEIKVNLKN